MDELVRRPAEEDIRPLCALERTISLPPLDASQSLRPVQRLLRYGLTGLFNTLLSYALYSALLFAGLDYRFASLLSLIGGIVLSFFTLGRFVFAAKLRGRFHRFVIVWGLLYVLNIGLIGLLLRAGLNAYWGGLAAAVPCVALAYLAQRVYVFRDEPSQRGK